MKITIGQPLAFTEIGKKDNQEDRIYPPVNQLSPTENCFVLCDGMGGHENGEVAASIVSESLYNTLKANPPRGGIANKQWFEEALMTAYQQLDKMPYHTERRPGTTMICVYLAPNGIMAAHIGDSRIYVVSPQKGIIYRSEDHSLVNQLVRAGELTEEQAANYPRRNVITRAMQPGLERKYAADINIITDIHDGDYIFLCCDGILEQITDKLLCQIISQPSTPEQKLQAIHDACFDKTRDNFTCILIPVAKVEGTPEVATMVTPEPPVYNPAKRTAGKTGGSDEKTPTKNTHISHTLVAIVAIVVTLLICAAVYFFVLKPKDTKPRTQPATTDNPVDNNQQDNKDSNVPNIATADNNDSSPVKNNPTEETTPDLSHEKLAQAKILIKTEYNKLTITQQQDFINHTPGEDIKDHAIKKFVEKSVNALKEAGMKKDFIPAIKNIVEDTTHQRNRITDNDLKELKQQLNR